MYVPSLFLRFNAGKIWPLIIRFSFNYPYVYHGYFVYKRYFSLTKSSLHLCEGFFQKGHFKVVSTHFCFIFAYLMKLIMKRRHQISVRLIWFLAKQSLYGKEFLSKKQRQKEDQSKDYKTPNDEKVRKSSAENIEPSVPERYWQWVWHSFISFQVIVFVTHLFLTSFFCITRKTDFLQNSSCMKMLMTACFVYAL